MLVGWRCRGSDSSWRRRHRLCARYCGWRRKGRGTRGRGRMGWSCSWHWRRRRARIAARIAVAVRQNVAFASDPGARTHGATLGDAREPSRELGDQVAGSGEVGRASEQLFMRGVAKLANSIVETGHHGRLHAVGAQ